jgi:hypothetical protein
MPPVDEATFIAKADLLIGAINLVAVRLAALAVEVGDLKVSGSLNSGALAARLDALSAEVRETIDATASEMNAIETKRIKRIPLRHGSRGDGTL